MTDDGARRPTPFTKRQWVEICVFIVVVWSQVILQLAFGERLIAFVVGLVGLALIAHMVTWMLPLWRSGEWRRRS
jgi:hypothetical protein